MVDFIKLLITAAAGLGGVFLGGWLSDRREQKKAATDFIKLQLANFYGPLLSLRKEIFARSDLRVKIQQVSDSQYMDDLIEAGTHQHGNIDQVTDEHIPSLLAMMKDEDYVFRELLMPLYRDMVAIFRTKMWLSEIETRAYFLDFVQFVDVWDRILRGALPHAIAPAIGHTEAKLHPFYEHLESTHDQLRRTLTQSIRPH